jgi:hypothetical protein
MSLNKLEDLIELLEDKGFEIDSIQRESCHKEVLKSTKGDDKLTIVRDNGILAIYTDINTLETKWEESGEDIDEVSGKAIKQLK